MLGPEHRPFQPRPAEFHYSLTRPAIASPVLHTFVVRQAASFVSASDDIWP